LLHHPPENRPASLTVPSILANELFTILATAEGPAPAAFAGEAGAACRAMALDEVDVTWLSASPALREIYVARRTLLAQRGVDVVGLNALLRYVDAAREGTRIGCFVVHAVDANLVGFFDDRDRRLVGWVRVPVDLPPPVGGAVLPEDTAGTDGRTKPRR
jgi:hypothetical protein